MILRIQAGLNSNAFVTNTAFAQAISATQQKMGDPWNKEPGHKYHIFINTSENGEDVAFEYEVPARESYDRLSSYNPELLPIKDVEFIDRLKKKAKNLDHDAIDKLCRDNAAQLYEIENRPYRSWDNSVSYFHITRSHIYAYLSSKDKEFVDGITRQIDESDPNNEAAANLYTKNKKQLDDIERRTSLKFWQAYVKEIRQRVNTLEGGPIFEQNPISKHLLPHLNGETPANGCKFSEKPQPKNEYHSAECVPEVIEGIGTDIRFRWTEYELRERESYEDIKTKFIDDPTDRKLIENLRKQEKELDHNAFDALLFKNSLGIMRIHNQIHSEYSPTYDVYNKIVLNFYNPEGQGKSEEFNAKNLLTPEEWEKYATPLLPKLKYALDKDTGTHESDLKGISADPDLRNPDFAKNVDDVVSLLKERRRLYWSHKITLPYKGEPYSK
jgi:hypothetical protein